MNKNFKQLRDKMSPEARKASGLKKKEMIAEMLLSEIRKEAGLTQGDLAKMLGIKQPSLSKLESQEDMQISTLRKIVDALGGHLEIIAHLPKGDLKIGQFKTA